MGKLGGRKKFAEVAELCGTVRYSAGKVSDFFKFGPRAESYSIGHGSKLSYLFCMTTNEIEQLLAGIEGLLKKLLKERPSWKEQRHLTVTDVADILRVRKEKVKYWIKQGELDAYEANGPHEQKHVQITPEALQAFIAVRRVRQTFRRGRGRPPQSK